MSQGPCSFTCTHPPHILLSTWWPSEAWQNGGAHTVGPGLTKTSTGKVVHTEIANQGAWF